MNKMIFAVLLLFIPEFCCADSPEYPYPGFNKYFQTLGYNLTLGLISSENLKPLYIGGLSTGVAYGFDETLSHILSPYAKPIGEAGQILGSPMVMGLTA